MDFRFSVQKLTPKLTKDKCSEQAVRLICRCAHAQRLKTDVSYANVNSLAAHLQLVEDHPVAVLLLGVEAVRPPAVELVDQPIQIPLILFILDNFLV